MTSNPTSGRASSGPSPAEELATSLAALIDESQALRVDVRSSEMARRRSNRISLGVLGLLVLFVGLLMAVTWQNNQLAHQVNETNRQMADCTTPGGRCYETGRERTSAAIADIVRASVFMSQCSRLYPGEVGPEYDKKLEQCVGERLAAAASQREDPKPTPTGGGSGVTSGPSPTRTR